jgi:hypothetical protein
VLGGAGCGEEANPETIVVGPGGHATITSAMDAASDGDTVLIGTGEYAETMKVDAGISITADGGPVLIDGDCSRANGILIGSDGVSIRGIGVRNTTEAAVRINASDDVSLDRMVITDYNCDGGEEQFEAGIASWEGGARLRVTNSEIVRRSDGSEPRGYGNGIWVKNDDENSGGGHYIAGNHITGGFDGIGGEPEDEAYGGFYRDAVIEKNTIRDCWDDGIQVEGGASDVVVRENDIAGCGSGVALAPFQGGPLVIERNQVHDLVTGVHDLQAAFKLGDGASGEVHFTDNVVMTKGDGFKQTNAGSVGTVVSRGNVISVSGRVMELGEVPTESDFDVDCLWSTASDRFIVWNGDEYQGLSDFQGGTGQEQDGTESPDCKPPAEN